MIPNQPAGRIKVARDGPRGWHWISAAHFDPAKHEPINDAPPPPAAAAPAAKRAVGRPPKQASTE
jgi:hypothetical protein